MESVSTLFARTFVRYATLDASTRSPVSTLLAVLNEHLVAAGLASTSGAGLIITEQAGNGHSFKAIESSGLSVVAYSQMMDLILTIYGQAVTELGIEGVATPNDAQISQRMLLLLFPRNSESVDYSMMTQVGGS